MFAQLFLGIFFIVKGIVLYFSKKPNFFFAEVKLRNVSKEASANYLRTVGKVNIIFGVIVVAMGQIEYRINLDPWMYLITYIIIGLSLITSLLLLNKKYTGNYILR